MKVLVDTNILFSAILNENSRVAKALIYVSLYHEMVFAEQNLWEIREIIRRKMPTKKRAMEKLLRTLSYDVIKTLEDTEIEMRDAKDKPILLAAIQNGVDIILTGDKDFLVLKIKHPRCMNVAEFFEEYLND
ncbi:putative toxin-antitoxin system toxin component, PIN family [Candidatus Saccharibacteria bacterium]|nr:putative toxin-antitoxin system toxin component, PIN family [Candidatus Saccharibacteria bacterium]